MIVEESHDLLLLTAASMGISVPIPPSISIGDCLLLERCLRQHLRLDDECRDGQSEEVGKQRIFPMENSVAERASSMILCNISPPPHRISSCASPKSELFNDSQNHDSRDCCMNRICVPPSSLSTPIYANEKDFGGFSDHGEGILEDESSQFSPLNLLPLHINRDNHGAHLDINVNIFHKKGYKSIDYVKKNIEKEFDWVRFDDISSVAPDESTTTVLSEGDNDMDFMANANESRSYCLRDISIVNDDSLLDSQAIIGSRAPSQTSCYAPLYRRKPLNLMVKQQKEEMSSINQNHEEEKEEENSIKNVKNTTSVNKYMEKLMEWIYPSREDMRRKVVQYSDALRENIYTAVLKGCMKAINTNSSQLRGGLLIVTSKQHVESWAAPIRGAKDSFSDVSMEVYTQSLQVRRKLGVSRLSNYDVVITTFDILKAKEAVVPEVEMSDATARGIDDEMDDDTKTCFQEKENIVEGSGFKSKSKSEYGSLMGQQSWLQARKTLEGGTRGSLMIELSQLHLIKWGTIILDINSQTTINGRNAKGHAAKALKSDYTFGMTEHVNVRDGPFSKSTLNGDPGVRALRGLLKAPMTSSLEIATSTENGGICFSKA